MRKVGSAYPNSIDLITQSEEEVRLVIVEEEALDDEAALALQEKLNNYLSYALDGELLKQYPAISSKQVIIRVEFWARPTAFILEFLARYKEAVAEHQVPVEVTIEGSAVL